MIIPGEGAGKGDVPRPVNKKEFDKNFEIAFGKKDYCSICEGRTNHTEKGICADCGN